MTDNDTAEQRELMFEKDPEAMKEITLKEKIAFNFIFNEKRVYHRWYGRWFVFGLDYGRLKRVVPRINNWFEWCREWDREGMEVEKMADEALAKGNSFSAKTLYHQAVACYHIGQHIFFSKRSRPLPSKRALTHAAAGIEGNRGTSSP